MIEHTLQQLVEDLPQGSVLLDDHGAFVFMNEKAIELTGTEKMEMMMELFKDQRWSQNRQEIDLVVQGQKRCILVDRVPVRIDPDDAQAEPWTILYLTDITPLKVIQQNLHELEERYTLVMQGINDGLWDWDLRKKKVFYSSRWKYMLGYAEHEIRSEPSAWLDLVHAEDKKRLGMEINQHLRGNTAFFECEYRILHRDGSYRWVLSRGLAIRDNEGHPYRMAGSQSDITSRKQAEEQLRFRAFYDPLTELPNRVLLLEKIQAAIQRAQRSKDYEFALLFMDLDRFKIVNDSLGHLIGDQLLKLIARRLEKVIRVSDTFSRISGDEFVFLLDPTKSQQDAILVADRIHSAFQKPFKVEGKEIFTSASVGIVFYNSSYENPNDLMRDADNAMYRAKEKGNSQWEIFRDDMYASSVEQYQTEILFRKAVDQKQFTVQFQPIMDLNTGSITAVEALVRWEKEKGLLLDTKDFLALAEETGLIHDIDQWVLERICMFHASLRLKKKSHIRICANLSLIELKNPNLIPWLKLNLDKYKITPGHIDLEFKESALFGEVHEELPVLDQLKRLGVGISLDDYGSGSAHFSFLKSFPLSRLKLHQSLIQGIEKNPQDAAIIKAIISMAHNLGQRVVAVGVETEKQLDMLKGFQCNEAQGYAFHKPMDFKELIKLLKSS